jgi:hypothetical protein
VGPDADPARERAKDVCLALGTKELPQDGAIGRARAKLYAERLWEVKVVFTTRVERLGCSGDDRCREDVYMWHPDGREGGIQGSYGGSYAALYRPNDVSAVAAGGGVATSVPEGAAILTIYRHWRKSWATLYLNPCHMNGRLLPAAPTLSETDRRILACFRGLKSGAYRQEALERLGYNATVRDRLAAAGLLKVAKNGATKITPAGRNACSSTRPE